MAAPVGRARFTAGLVPSSRGGWGAHSVCPLRGCASRQLFPDFIIAPKRRLAHLQPPMHSWVKQRREDAAAFCYVYGAA